MAQIMETTALRADPGLCSDRSGATNPNTPSKSGGRSGWVEGHLNRRIPGVASV